MNINKKILSIYLAIFLFVFYNTYKSMHQNRYNLPSKAILSFTDKPFLEYQTIYSTDGDFNHYWGFPKDIATIIIKKDTNNTKKTQVIQPNGKNILCIKKSCYSLIGIYNNQVTLYNKDTKPKIQDFTKDEKINNIIKITKITSHKVFFKELTSKQNFIFKIFDVNQTKYKPKGTYNVQH